jgi:hypothetical protein
MIMAKREKLKINWSFERLVKVLLIVAGIISLFTFFDFIIHSLSNEYAVPSYYFRNKIIFGTLWAFFIYLILRKWKIALSLKSFVFSALIAGILQARYYYEGYPLDFVIEFLFFHFFILWVVSYIVFRVLKKEM